MKNKKIDVKSDGGKVVDLVKKELEKDYKRGFIKELDFVSVLGYGLNSLCSGGKCGYKETYKYRYDIKRFIKDSINNKVKIIDEGEKSKRELNKENKKRVGK